MALTAPSPSGARAVRLPAEIGGRPSALTARTPAGARAVRDFVTPCSRLTALTLPSSSVARRPAPARWALLLGGALTALTLLAPSPALADSPEAPASLLEAGLGYLMLPGAEVCANRTQPCSKGDASLEAHLWQITRLTPRWGVGGGATLAFAPRTDLAEEPEVDAARDLTRAYLTLELTGRYYFVLRPALDAWLGATGGLVVIRDAWQLPRPPYAQIVVGSDGLALATAGGALGLAAGASFRFAESWMVGGALRFSQWLFPSERQVGPLDNTASLAGRVSAVDFGVEVTYRAEL